LGTNEFLGYSFARNGMENILKVDLPLIELGSYLTSTKRIGPHNKDILDFIHGSLLGDGYLELHGNGSRLCLQQESSNKAYLLWSHQFLANRGYCNLELPKIQSRIGNKGKIRYVLRLKTWTFSSLNYLHHKFYSNNIKIIPQDLYLNPFILAIWIKNDGSRSGKALKLSTNCFTYEECEILKIKLNNMNLKISIHKTGAKPHQYN
jgi:hypothetical protein